MKTALVINHPKNNGSENRRLEKALGGEVHITHMTLSGFTKDRIKSLSTSCDNLLFFHTTLEKIKHLIDTSTGGCDNICKIVPGHVLGEYRLESI